MKKRALILTTSLAVLLPVLAALADHPTKGDGGILFVYRDAGANQVALAGEFNGWSTMATPMERDEDGAWRVTVPLGQGSHQYKYVVDGNWVADPDNPRTAGDYGNSVITVNARGEVAEEDGGGRRPSPMNAKLFAEGLYYATVKAEAREDQNRRVMIEKPRHSLDLALVMELNPSLVGRVELNADNLAQNTEMWKTRLNFQRSTLVLTRPGFTLTLFDNDAVWRSEDLLGLVGNVNTEQYDYGYGARGALLEMALPYGFQLTGLAADATREYYGDMIDISQMDSLGAGSEYVYGHAPDFRDDLALQITRDLGPGRLLYLARALRGIHPGELTFSEGSAADSLDTWGYLTLQDNLLHALSYRMKAGPSMLELEGVLGQADLSANEEQWLQTAGEENVFTLGGDWSWRIQDTRGLAVAAGQSLPWGLSLDLEHRFQENRNAFPHFESMPDMLLQSRLYRGSVSWTGKHASYSLSACQEEYHYSGKAQWGDQLAFDDGVIGAGNLWINGDQLPQWKWPVLGYDSASYWKQNLRADLSLGSDRPLWLDLTHTLVSTRLDREALYWELVAELDWQFREGWNLLYNQRMARYDQDFLSLNEQYAAGFLELSYRVTRSTMISLGWGVDPYQLDPVSKRFDDQGRRRYLIDQGADEDELRSNYGVFGGKLHEAERSLADARLLTLEARYVF